MKKIAPIVVMFFLAASLAACGTDISHGFNVTISPVDGATGQALNVSVTAQFSADIATPIDWYQSFTLKKDGAGANLCTNITYSSQSVTAVCTHAALDPSASYQVQITTITAVNGKIINFTTAAAAAQVAVSSMERVVLPLSGKGFARSLKFEFALADGSAVALGDDVTPVVKLASAGGDEIGAAECRPNEERTELQCDLDGLEIGDGAVVHLEGDGIEPYEAPLDGSGAETG